MHEVIMLMIVMVLMWGQITEIKKQQNEGNKQRTNMQKQTGSQRTNTNRQTDKQTNKQTDATTFSVAKSTP